MWIETQDGELINVENGNYVYLDERKCGWRVILDTTKHVYVLGKYETEKSARDMFDAFKQKLRRCGEKIFKFKEDGQNEVAD